MNGNENGDGALSREQLQNYFDQQDQAAHQDQLARQHATLWPASVDKRLSALSDRLAAVEAQLGLKAQA